MENDTTQIEELKPENLLFIDWCKLAWAFIWRGLIITIIVLICSIIIGGIFGGIIGFICGISGYPFENVKIPVQIFGGIIGAVIGFLFEILLIKWILKAKFSKFRIAIVKR